MGMAAVRNSRHYGIGGYHASMAAKEAVSESPVQTHVRPLPDLRC